MSFKPIYQVRRVDGECEPGKKHGACTFFVLDLECDKYARVALEAYASACEKEMPIVAEELRKRLSTKHTDPILAGIQERMRELARLSPQPKPKEAQPETPKMTRAEELSKMFSGEIKKKRGRPPKKR